MHTMSSEKVNPSISRRNDGMNYARLRGVTVPSVWGVKVRLNEALNNFLLALARDPVVQIYRLRSMLVLNGLYDCVQFIT